MKIHRFILVGAGGFGAAWCAHFIPKVTSFAQCTALVDIRQDALDNAKQYKLVPDDRYYSDLELAIEENPCDFLAVVVPPEVRPGIIDIAIRYRLDVLSEKPVAGTMEECVTIYRKMKAAGLKIAVTMSHRMEREKQTLEHLVKSGTYGKLNYIYGRLAMKRASYPAIGRYAEIQTLPLYDVRRRGLSEGVIHELDTLRGIAGSNAAQVFCKYWLFDSAGSRKESCSFTQVTMENGVQCLIEHSSGNAATLNGWGNEHFRAECEFATLTADHQNVTLQSDLGLPFPSQAQMPLLDGEYFDHSLLIYDFCRWREGGPEPATSLEDNLQCLALTFAALESAETGREIDVQEFLQKSLS